MLFIVMLVLEKEELKRGIGSPAKNFESRQSGSGQTGDGKSGCQHFRNQ